MSLKATVYKLELQISDLDRHYYCAHKLTLAQHPSETQTRMMVRALAFALNAAEYLNFAGGLSSEDEPDLWLRDLTGGVDLWIDVGQPDEARIRRACGRARQVVIYTYSGHSAQIWWDKNGASLARNKNLSVINLAASACTELATLAERSMSLSCILQDGEIQMISPNTTVTLIPAIWLASAT
jgi:uncharacterized protein YaeQ